MGSGALIPALAVRDLTVTRGPARSVLTGVSFDLAPGELGVILGANGAGKTTLAAALAGLLDSGPDGEVRVGEEVLSGPDPARVALVSDTVADPFLTRRVEDEVRLSLQFRGRDPAGEERPWLEALGLAALAHRDPETLSGGERQRLLWAAALVHEPAVLVLDDPFLFLDPAAARAGWALLRERLRAGTPRAVLLLAPDADLAVEGDRVGVLDGGRLLGLAAPEQVLREGLPEGLAPPFSVALERRLRELGRPLPAGGLRPEEAAARFGEIPWS